MRHNEHRSLRLDQRGQMPVNGAIAPEYHHRVGLLQFVSKLDFRSAEWCEIAFLCSRAENRRCAHHDRAAGYQIYGIVERSSYEIETRRIARPTRKVSSVGT